MKFRKLIALLTAAVIAASQFAAMPVYAAGETVPGASSPTDSPVTPPEDDNQDFVSRYGLNAFDRLFENKDYSGFEDFLSSYIYQNGIPGSVTLERYASLNPDDGSFPVCLSYENILTLRRYYLNENRSIVVTVHVTDPRTGIVYHVKITSEQAGKLTDQQLLTIKNKTDGIYYAINFSFDDKNKRVNLMGYDTSYNDIGFSFRYQIYNTDFVSMLSSAKLINDFGNADGTLALYALGTDELLYTGSNVDARHDLIFSIGDTNRRGSYIALLDETEETFKRTEAIAYVEELLNKYIGLENGQVEGIDSDFKNTNDFIKNAIIDISAELQDFTTESKLRQMVSDYYFENKPELLKAMVADIDISKSIRDELDEILGDEVEEDDEKDLEEYIYEKVVEEILKLLIQYETPIDSDIFKTLHFLLLGRITDSVEDLRDDIIASITNGKSISEFVESLRGKDGADGKDGEDGKDGTDGKDGQDGKDGTDGKDGENFEDWVVRKYGSLDNFISTISFEGWAKRNYGSVDNFVKAMTGDTGLSAYELAVENGYRGTLGMWLESLQGDDGLSAYELAVRNGYSGTLSMWLESLRGEDGQDGRDGRDGRDGKDGKDGKDGTDGTNAKVVYVAADTYSSGGDDVVLISPSKTPVAGNVNPSTGITAGILLPAAAVGSVLLVRKGKRKRGRRR